MCKLVSIIILSLIISLTAGPQEFSIWKDDKAPVTAESFESKYVKITVHTPVENSGKAVIICPGGGYGGLVTGGEGHGIAKWLNGHGITGIVLEYRLPKGRKYVPVFDANRAVRYVRHHAEKFGINKNKIGIIGFSAGGHLASTALVHQLNCPADDEVSKESARPDFGILIYPVITLGEGTHKGSKNNLLGKDPSEEDLKFFSTELQVNKNTPPTFLAHAADDKPVPPINSKVFHENLKKTGVATKYLQLPSGGHGLNGYKGPMWDAWQKESLVWIDKILK